MTSDTTLVDAELFPRLIVKTGGRVLREIELRRDISIGRAEENELQLMDPKASRHHARISREGATFVLTDLDSANGTRVNGVRISAPHVMRHGERITIGDTELAYQEPGQSFQDTLTVKGVAAGTQTHVGQRVPPPPGAGAQAAERRGMSPVMIAIVAVVGLALIAAAILVIFNLGGSPATPTAVAVVASATSAPPTAEPQATPEPTVEAGTPVSSGVDPQEVNDLLTQAEALGRRSKFADAEAIYQNLSERVPDDARPEVGWAWALILDDRPADALPHAQKAVELDPASADAAAVLGRVYVDLEDKDLALQMAQKAVDLDPSSAGAHTVLAEAYMLNGQTGDAVDEADLALVQNINEAEAHRVRGWLYHIADNDMGRAASELQIAAGLQPELWLRRHDLGILLLEAEDYVTSIMAFQDALGIHPKAITYVAIGEAYYHLGQYDQAKVSLEQAIGGGTDDVEAYALLAATYAHLNRCEDAETYYQQVLDEEPTQPLALEAQELCQAGEPVPTPSPTVPSPSEPTPVAPPASTASPARPTARPAAVSGRIAFPVWNQETGKYDTYVSNADGSGRHLAVEGMHQPAFRPDGGWLSVNGEIGEHMNLFVLKPDGSGQREISENMEDALPYWSPDGQSLVFSSRRHGDKQSRVYVIDDMDLEKSRKPDVRTLNFGPDDVRGEYPTWTADGRIVYNGCDLTTEPSPCGLFAMPATPGVHPFTQLTDRGEDTAPAAHGDKIAFMSNREGNWEIYVMNGDGSGLQRLTSNAANDGLPTWSPDGKTIAFVSDQGGGWAVWAMSPDGSNRRKLFSIGGGGLAFDWQHERISWAP